MSRYVLVHGAWHGPWCWSELSPRLTARGHTVELVELPGRGADPTPPGQTHLADYAQRIADMLRSRDEPALLVGHSMGGMSITQAAEWAPDHIERLVYLTAFVPLDGESLTQAASIGVDGSPAGRSARRSHEDGATALPREVSFELLYGGCDRELAEAAADRLVPEGIGPQREPVTLTEANHGRVATAYIECLRDEAIPIVQQRALHTRRGIATVASLDADHSPFLSMPDELVVALETVAAG